MKWLRGALKWSLLDFELWLYYGAGLAIALVIIGEEDDWQAVFVVAPLLIVFGLILRLVRTRLLGLRLRGRSR